jgi:hypothetical protein
MKKQRTLMAILVLVATWGMVLSTYGQEKDKREDTSGEKTGFTFARAAVGTGVDNKELAGTSDDALSSPKYRQPDYQCCNGAGCMCGWVVREVSGYHHAVLKDGLSRN